MNARTSWRTTTHSWAYDLDVAHLTEVRRATELAEGGARHLVLEVLAYAADEAESLGRKGLARITVEGDGSFAVRDDGRGTDTRRDEHGRVVRKPVMATRDVRFFDAEAPPLLPDGLPRRGMSTVAALSTWLVHENHRAGQAWSQTYRHGVPDHELTEVVASRQPGTEVRFLPDPGLVPTVPLCPEDLTAFAWLTIEMSEQQC